MQQPRRLRKRSLAVLLALTLGVSAASSLPQISAANTDAVPLGTYEAEDFCDDQVWTDIYGTVIGGGYSGDGFIYLTNSTITITVTVEEEGMYDISVRCAQILDTDTRLQTYSVNGTDYTYKLAYSADWVDVSFGIVRLQAGENVIQFKPYYGYACYDTITISEANLPTLCGTSETCDENATSETKSLMSYLNSVYGTNIISGQQEIYGGGHDGDYEQEFEYIYETTGEYPAIRGFDLMNYNPLYGWDDGTTERIIEWVNDRNGIATVCWHINIPSNFDSYTIGEELDWTACTYGTNSTFSVANAVTSGTKENQYLDLAIACLAEQLLTLQENNVPVIFRPFHEAEGNGGLDGSGSWFWWSQDGVEAYKDLWIYLYTALTEDYGIHNLIWEENLYAWSSESAEWYVGDDYVDIVGWDKYDTVYNRHDGLTSGPNEDAESSIFYSLVEYVNNGKMVSMPENSTIPSLSNLLIEKAGWLYFCTWYDNGSDNFISGSDYQNVDTLIELYQSEYCITLGELPSDLYTSAGSSSSEEPEEPTTTEPTSTDPTDDAVTTEPATGTYLMGDVNEDGDVSIIDVILLMQMITGTEKTTDYALVVGDVNGEEGLSSDDALVILRYLVDLTTLPDAPNA